jgi:hypothetical protein
MFKLRTLLIAILISIICIDASTVRRSLLENLNSGLKLLGKNDRRPLDNRYYYLKRFQQSGVSSNIADLVSQTFSPAKHINRNSNRQDTIVLGDEGTAPASSLSENSIMSGLLKLLGFDGGKIGAAAINGIVFLAQMVRFSANKFMDFMMTKTWDWYLIVDHINKKIKDDKFFNNNNDKVKDETNSSSQEFETVTRIWI